MSIRDISIIFIISILVNGIMHGLVKGVGGYFEKSISGIPERSHDISMEDLRSQKAYELQIDSFFRDVSTKEISNLLNDWYNLAFNPKRITDIPQNKLENKISDMINKTIAYGSKETIRRLAVFQYNNYINEANKMKDNYQPEYYSSGESLDKNTYVMMYLISYIVASFKKDFTGADIDPNDLMKIKIKDYSKHEDSFERAHKDAKELLHIK